MREVSISDTFSISDLRNLKKENIEISVLSILKKKGKNPSFFDEEISFYKSDIRSLLNIFIRPLIFFDALFFVLKTNKFDLQNLIKSLYIIPNSIEVLNNLKNIRPEIVHLFWGHYPSLVGYLVLRYLKDSKLSMFLGAYDIHVKNPMSKIIYEKCDFLITHSHSNIKLIKEEFRIDRSIEVIERGVDRSYLDIRNEKEPRDKNTMTFAGRLIKDKNVETIIDAYSKSLKLNTNLKLDIYGDGIWKDFLEKYAKNSCPNGKIIFHGQTDQKILSKKLHQSNIFVFASKKKGEILPNALKEAMYAGCICITTRTPGVESLINNGVNGFIEDNNANDISSRINKILLSNEKELESMRDLASQKIIEDFDASNSMNKYIKLWQINT
tara:strand:+ start:405 stop:1553 length:1149 start_codon:yes stop_codon:yes gene_type:complete